MVLKFMHRRPIAATWGRADLASSDMMSLETAKRVGQADETQAVADALSLLDNIVMAVS